MNGSAKIEVVDPLTFVSSATITGFNTPTYILPVNNTKAYVTDLYAKFITIVDLTTNTIAGKIPFAAGTIEPILVEDKVYFPAQSGDQLYILDIKNDKVTDSIRIDYGANTMVRDKNGRLWVLCSGHFAPGEYFLHCIDPVNNKVVSSFNFPNAGDSPWRLNINKTRDTLYYLNKGVNRMAINDATLPAEPFIKQENRNFYGLGINPNNGNIYVCDALDFVQRGRIEIYHPDGKLYKNFLAGIIPNGFYFR